MWLWYQHCYNTNKQTKSLSIFSMAADITHAEVCALFGFLCFFSILSACAWLAANCILINKISNKPQRRAEPSRGIWNEFTALVFVHTKEIKRYKGDSLFLCVCICVFGDTKLAWPGAPLKSLTGVGLRREPICPYVCEQSDRRRMREPGGGVRAGGGGWYYCRQISRVRCCHDKGLTWGGHCEPCLRWEDAATGSQVIGLCNSNKSQQKPTATNLVYSAHRCAKACCHKRSAS